jgi:hypothetical protein
VEPADDNLPPLIDFDHAYIAWTTHAESHARFRIVASAVFRPPGKGWQDRFVLAPMVMAGDVYGAGQLPLDPPYSFQFFASPERHVIVRGFSEGAPKGDSIATNGETFSSLAIHAPKQALRPVTAADLTPDHLAWPITARAHVQANDGVRWLLDFPILHVNTRRSPQPAFQIETGPLLVPEELLDPGPAILGGFALAYVFFNRLDRIDLSLFGRSGRGRTYGQFGRLDEVSIELFRPADRTEQ